MISPIVKNFMRQQGFAEESDSVCDVHFSGLYFQPRIMGTLVVVAIFLQNPVFFFALSAVLWWNVVFRRWNPFEMIYNRAIAGPHGKPLLAPAPAPRAFAQGMAAYMVEAFLVIAFAALLFGKFCLGAYVYHLLRGRIAFANSTLPWAHPQP